jgi:hypothetical protein
MHESQVPTILQLTWRSSSSMEVFNHFCSDPIHNSWDPIWCLLKCCCCLKVARYPLFQQSCKYMSQMWFRDGNINENFGVKQALPCSKPLSVSLAHEVKRSSSRSLSTSWNLHQTISSAVLSLVLFDSMVTQLHSRKKFRHKLGT